MSSLKETYQQASDSEDFPVTSSLGHSLPLHDTIVLMLILAAFSYQQQAKVQKNSIGKIKNLNDSDP